MVVKVDSGRCNGCGNCIESCPVEALALNKKSRQAEVNEQECIDCGVCVENCPTEALTLD